MNSSNWTGRTHRTMAEAFGPYTGRELYSPPDPSRERRDALVAILATVVGMAAIGVILAWRV